MIGVDVSSRSIKAVEIVEEDGAVLKTSCWSALPPKLIRRGVIQDGDQVAQVLKKTLVACSPVPTTSNEVIASIPEVQSFIRVLELPLMGEKELDEAVPWAVKKHIPFDLDTVYLDWELLAGSRKSNQYRILVGVAQRSVVDPLLGMLDKVGLNVIALELEGQAVVRCLLPRDPVESRDINGVLIVDMGATSTNVVFFDRGAMRYTASIQFGGDDLTRRLAYQLKIEPSEAIEKKAQVGLTATGQDAQAASILRLGALELGEKVARVVRDMSAQLPSEQHLRVVLLSGGGANLPGFVELFSEVFPGVPVQIGNPWTNIRRDKGTRGINLSTADALHFSTALGLALRRVNYVA